MSLIASINLSIGIAGAVISLLGLGQAIIYRHFQWNAQKWFFLIFGIMVLFALSNLIGQIAGLFPTPAGAKVACVSLFFESMFPSLLMLLLNGLILVSAGEKDWRHSRFFLAASVLWGVYLILLIYTQFSSSIYSIDDENVYRRGPLYPLLLTPPVLIMAVNASLLWQKRRLLSRKELFAFSIYTGLPLAAMLIQLLFFGIYTILLGSTIAGIIMFSYVAIDQSERYYSQEQENAKLKVDVLLAQIQPHFLYNSLSVIQEVCVEDPQKASDAIADFAEYLRHNMESIHSDKPVLFSVELDHTKEYLRLQQLRFYGALQVEYRIGCTDFCIPALTLQPIVENAVKHGVRKKEDGRGKVTVSTRECPDHYEVTVEDDGPGFDPASLAAHPEKPHIGLQNVTERLRRMTGGSLQIHSRPGQGTTVILSIPKEGSL